MKILNDKTQEQKLNLLRKSKNKGQEINNGESDFIKLEHIRTFASIVIDIYFSKQENKKL